MAEKVLHELRVIETEEGFRIEIKGDKEQIKKMFLGRMNHHHGGFGWGRRWGRGHGFPFPFQAPHFEEDERPARF